MLPPDAFEAAAIGRPALTLVGRGVVGRLPPARAHGAGPRCTADEDGVGAHVDALREVAHTLRRTLSTLPHPMSREDAACIAHASHQIMAESARVPSPVLREAAQRAAIGCQELGERSSRLTSASEVSALVAQLAAVHMGCAVLAEQLRDALREMLRASLARPAASSPSDVPPNVPPDVTR